MHKPPFNPCARSAPTFTGNTFFVCVSLLLCSTNVWHFSEFPLFFFVVFCVSGRLSLQGERNFHILYELVAGAPKCGLAKELQVRKDVP